VARDGVAVDAEVAAAVAAYADGVQMNVAARCRELGIAPKTFYKYVGRFRELGVPGLFPDSRRPLSSPTRLPAAWEDLLVTVRKEEAEAGWDYGADAVLMRLEEQPRRWPDPGPLPSRATVNRVFEARGVLAKTPQRRPRRRYRRFERAEINALWQFDGFEYLLADGVKAIVLHLSDDCSRTDLALQAVTSENGADAWCTFCVAVDRYGLPAQMLSDNGLAFSGKRRGWTSDLERRLAVLGVQAITARVGHPQTCGKNERAHQRVQKWLARRPPARDLAELQQLLDTYREAYNNRRNRVLGKLTPHQRFQLGPIAYPTDFDQPTVLTRHTVSATGSIGVDGHLIGLGRRHHGKAATVFRSGDHVVVLINDQLARDLTIDRLRHYQPQDR
jgi:transposase InsO family protein